MILYSYTRKDSPWVHVKYSPYPGAAVKVERTLVRKTDVDRERKVRLVLNDIEKQMLTEIPADVADGRVSPRDTWLWVESFLATRYGKGGSLVVYRAQWRPLTAFMLEHGIRRPAELTRAHCADLYVPWRTSQVKKKSKRTPCTNTAINELKLLAILMDEAVLRGAAADNPARRLKIEREEVMPKPEITDDEVSKIYAALAARPAWMQRSFHIALQTGLRFAETKILRHQVRWADGLISVEKPKGGRKRAFSIPIYPQIEAMLVEFRESGDPVLWSLPDSPTILTGMEWTKFFRSIGLSHLCFHCTRVTFISRGARAGIPQSAMMSMVNHASADIHRIYQRFRGADVLRYRDLIQMPSPPRQGPTASAAIN